MNLVSNALSSLFKPIAFLGFGFLFILSLAACSEEKKEAPAPEARKVGVVKAKSVKIPSTETFNGTLTASETVEVRARVSGYVAERLFEEGSRVEKGQALYRLDDRNLKAALETAIANTARAQSTWDQEAITRQRMVALAEKGSISLQQRDKAVHAEEEAKAALEAAKAEEEDARVNLSYATITAPTDGFISRSEVEVGGNVDAGNSTLLTTVYNVDPIRAEFYINDKQSLEFQKKILKGEEHNIDELVFYLELGDERLPYDQKGILEMADPVVDPKTNTLGVRVSFPNPKQVLRPGMYVNIISVLGEEEGILIPEVALVDQTGGAKAVYTINENSELVLTPVTLGQRAGENRVILSGLVAEQEVVVEGLVSARPGLKVEAVLQEYNPPAKLLTPEEEAVAAEDEVAAAEISEAEVKNDEAEAAETNEAEVNETP